jgi:predicted O-methyltransferase YrrM
MKFDAVATHLDGIPYTSPQKGRVFYDFIMDTRPEQCLELGFAHGVSSCYIAAALHELGRGHLTTVDLVGSKDWFNPTIETLLARTGLESYVTVVRETTSYTWFLKKKIEQQTRDHACVPCYDFCFIDGCKNWTHDGAAFFMVDKLLRSGGWIMFDDLWWTSALEESRSGLKEAAGVPHSQLADDEYRDPHIEAIFRLLVTQHPSYARFKVLDEMLALAQKTAGDMKQIQFESMVSFKYRLVSLVKRVTGRTRKGRFSHHPTVP